MRTLHLVFSLILVAPLLNAQSSTTQDPFLGGYVIANSAEPVYLHSTPATPAMTTRMWDVDTTSGALTGGILVTYPDTSGVNSAGETDLACGDLDLDGKDELVTVWAGADNRLRIGVEKPSHASGGSWEFSGRATYYFPADTIRSHLRVRLAQLDADPVPELVVAYWNTSGAIRIAIFDFDASLIPHRTTSVADIQYTNPPGAYAQIDLATGDFNRDERDEILVGYSVGPISNWASVNFRLKAYKYDASIEKLSPGTDALINLLRPGVLNQKWRDAFALTAGDFDNDGYDEAALAFCDVHEPDILLTTECDLVVLPISVNPGLDGFAASAAWAVKVDSWGPLPLADPPVGGVSISCGDIDLDGAAEVVVAGMNTVAVLEMDTWPTFIKRATSAFTTRRGEQSRRLVALADLDASATQASWVPEVIVADFSTASWLSTTATGPRIRTFALVVDTTSVPRRVTGFVQKGLITIGAPAVSRFAVAAGDFDGDGVRLRNPRLITVAKFVQPLVILNAPPTHYDILDGHAYDVCTMLPGNTTFKSTYVKELASEEEFSSEETRDWSISASIGGSFRSMLGLNFSASYGRSFSKKTDSTTKFIVQDEVHTSGDDYLFAATSSYEFWEYPVSAAGVSFGNVIVTIPRLSQLSWMPAKNPDAFHYQPTHEVGNVLSYMSEQALPGSPDIASVICGTFPGYTISEQAGKTWDVFLSQSQSAQEEWTNSVHTELGGSLSGWGIEIGASGSYDRKEVTTHRSKATRDVKITLEVGEPDASLGMADYKITPIVYWATNGALTVDFSTEPTVWSYPDTSLKTWWQRRYADKSDPALILPWRYDVEKTGDTVTAPGLRCLSRSIRVSPAVANPGDTVRITVRVDNFSLKATPGPVTLRLYVGNPDAGGIPIVGLGGVTELSTDGPLEARGMRTKDLLWVVDGGGTTLPAATRIYAKLDPDNTIDEIHEDNNTGWTVLTIPGGTAVGGEKGSGGVPVVSMLYQNYPNPFNPTTAVRFQVSAAGRVILTVYDLLGREVAVLANEVKEPGRYAVTWDGSRFASGIYFCRIQAGSYSAVKKMLLLK